MLRVSFRGASEQDRHERLSGSNSSDFDWTDLCNTALAFRWAVNVGLWQILLQKSQIARRQFSCCKKADRRPPIDVAPITLPRSPASLSSGNEVPHIFTRKSRVQPKEILITSAKRLLQQNRHERD